MRKLVASQPKVVLACTVRSRDRRGFHCQHLYRHLGLAPSANREQWTTWGYKTELWDANGASLVWDKLCNSLRRRFACWTEMSRFKIICHAGFIWTLLDFTSAQGKLRSPVVGQDGVFGGLSKSKPAKPSQSKTPRSTSWLSVDASALYHAQNKTSWFRNADMAKHELICFSTVGRGSRQIMRTVRCCMWTHRACEVRLRQ